MGLHFTISVSFESFLGIIEIIAVFIDSGNSFFIKNI